MTNDTVHWVGAVIVVRLDDGSQTSFEVLEDLGPLPDGTRKVRVESVDAPDTIAILAVGVADPAHLN